MPVVRDGRRLKRRLMPEFSGLENLDDLLTVAWQRLVAATQTAHHPWHLAVLATVDDGGEPDARTVVLRRVEPGSRRLMCHTDVRSPKFAALRRNPAATMLVYDPGDKVQLRVLGRVTVHGDDALADEQWAASTVSSRRCYLAPSPPTAESEGPSVNLPEHLLGRVPTQEESEEGRANFGVISVTAERIDLLHLAATGHRRALYSWPNGQLEAHWLHP